MIDDSQALDGRGQNWSVFFGVAAIFIGVLVLVSRLLAAFGDGGAAGGRGAEASSQGGGLVLTRPAQSYKPLLTPDTDVFVAVTVPAVEDAEPVPVAVAQPAAEAVPTEAEVAEQPLPPPLQAPEPPPAPVAPVVPPPSVSAASWAVVERSCGAIVGGRDENTRMAPASLTKIVTAMVVAERADLNRVVEIRDISAKWLVKNTDSSVMGIEPGNHFTVRELLFGLLLPSGNDAALALAQTVSGGVPGFVALMNDKAKGLGMNNTHFTNPHGLDDPSLFSSAFDMASAGRALLSNGMLAAMSIAPQFETSGDVRILMKNGNKLLQTYPGAFGVKIGYTTNAKQTIVAAARRGDRELVLSVLGSENRYEDSAALFDWAFANTASACR